jgi:hypothetical protein
MGKPYSIPKEDYIVRSAKTWFSQPGSQRSDSGLSAMVEMHRIVVSRSLSLLVTQILNPVLYRDASSTRCTRIPALSRA